MREEEKERKGKRKKGKKNEGDSDYCQKSKT